MHCPTCYSTRFRLSRIRAGDRLQLMFFRYPVRCRKCDARLYASRTYANYLRKLGRVSLREGEKEHVDDKDAEQGAG